jgi:hypothetical protein
MGRGDSQFVRHNGPTDTAVRASNPYKFSLQATIQVQRANCSLRHMSMKTGVNTMERRPRLLGSLLRPGEPRFRNALPPIKLMPSDHRALTPEHTYIRGSHKWRNCSHFQLKFCLHLIYPMHDTGLANSQSAIWAQQQYLAKSTNYEAPHYAAFSSLLSLHPS